MSNQESVKKQRRDELAKVVAWIILFAGIITIIIAIAAHFSWEIIILGFLLIAFFFLWLPMLNRITKIEKLLEEMKTNNNQK